MACLWFPFCLFVWVQSFPMSVTGGQVDGHDSLSISQLLTVFHLLQWFPTIAIRLIHTWDEVFTGLLWMEKNASIVLRINLLKGQFFIWNYFSMLWELNSFSYFFNVFTYKIKQIATQYDSKNFMWNFINVWNPEV